MQRIDACRPQVRFPDRIGSLRGSRALRGKIAVPDEQPFCALPLTVTSD
jgi:hypothetical protein